MKLEGRVFKANLNLAERTVEKSEVGDSFVKDLEWCFVKLCRELDIPIPLWLVKNTSEFAKFRQTIFFAEHFTENVSFDRFQIKLLK